MRLVKIKTRTIRKLPIIIHLPEHFVRLNNIERGDVIDFYITETGELIIKKESDVK